MGKCLASQFSLEAYYSCLKGGGRFSYRLSLITVFVCVVGGKSMPNREKYNYIFISQASCHSAILQLRALYCWGEGEGTTITSIFTN